jgi:hypothetical protein
MIFTDTIVFTQSELNKAVDSGAVSIALCDNDFILPSVPNIHYVAIGKVTASINLDNSEQHGIVCANFSTRTKKRPKIVHISNKAVGTASLTGGSYKLGSFSSSTGSYASSYKFGSYTSSYRTSYQTSYKALYKTSYSGSYSSSYRLSSSYKSSFLSSFKLSSFTHKFKHKMLNFAHAEISVNGYGIHLI